MKRRVSRFFVSFFAAAAFLTGCDLIDLGNNDSTDGEVGSIDLTATPVEFVRNDDNEITGVKLTISNLGSANAENVGYSIVASTDNSISVSADTVVYKGTIPLVEPEVPLPVTLDYDDTIGSYLTDHESDMPADGRYYWGVVLDPENTIVEEKETNNQSVSGENPWLIDKKLYTYALSFRVGVPAELYYYERDEVASTPEPSAAPVLSGPHQLYCTLIEGGYPPAFTPDLLGFVFINGDAVVEKFGNRAVTTVNYDASDGSVSEVLRIGFDHSAGYSLYVVMDATTDNTIVLQGTEGTDAMVSLDPSVTIPSDAMQSYLTVPLSQDKTLPDPASGGLVMTDGRCYIIPMAY